MFDCFLFVSPNMYVRVFGLEYVMELASYRTDLPPGCMCNRKTVGPSV